MGHRITSHVHINLFSHVSIKLYDLLMISIQSYSFSWPMPKKWILLTFQPGISGNTPAQGRPGHPNPVPFSAPSTASVRRIRHRHYLGVRKKSERTTELQKILWSWFRFNSIAHPKWISRQWAKNVDPSVTFKQTQTDGSFLTDMPMETFK